MYQLYCLTINKLYTTRVTVTNNFCHNCLKYITYDTIPNVLTLKECNQQNSPELFWNLLAQTLCLFIILFSRHIKYHNLKCTDRNWKPLTWVVRPESSIFDFRPTESGNRGIKHCFTSWSLPKTRPEAKLADEIAWSHRLYVHASLSGASLK